MSYRVVPDKNLYAVKRKNSAEFHTGYYSYTSPKLYVRRGDAERAREQLNARAARFAQSAPTEEYYLSLSKYYPRGDEEALEHHKNAVKFYEEEVARGDWVVVEATINVVWRGENPKS